MNTKPFTWLTKNITNQQLQFYQQLREKLSEDDAQELENLFSNTQNHLAKQLHKTICCSEFAKQLILRKPCLLLQEILPKKQSHRSSKETGTQFKNTKSLEDISKEIHPETDTELFNQQLRHIRQAAMLRIIWRDINRLADLTTTTTELSHLAEASIQACLAHHNALMQKKYGTPRNISGTEQPMLVLAMGKLGAYELNLSSDIDLIFTYPEKGQTDHPRNAIDNQDFFNRLGKKIIHSLDAQTEDGFVFRVDMRLRPYGQSGPLVCNFDALEDYYQTQGREWERYAMVKARIISSNTTYTITNKVNTNYNDELMLMLRQFTYRKYIDFSVIEALRSLKAAITSEVKRRQLQNDIKLGNGGIREIEFITQAFQLIRGGRELDLQDNRLLHILPLLAKKQYLPESTVQSLVEAYTFLRNTEHAIQAYQDKQTQKLPTEHNAQQALLLAMDFENWDDFYGTLAAHQQAVSQEFTAFIAAPLNETDKQTDNHALWQHLWLNAHDKASLITNLAQYNFEMAEESARQLHQFHLDIHNSAIHATGRNRLDALMPILLEKISEQANPSELLSQILPLIRQIVRRSAYLLLLIENPEALAHLLNLSGQSPWITKQLSERPALLDELIDRRSLFHLPNKNELLDELRKLMLRIDEDDLEEQMDTLRHFRSSHSLRVAACELTGTLDVMKVSDYLTYIAEAILETSLLLCWNAMLKKHGYPDGARDEQIPFIIVGYGKLGGIELGHGSDLDLVFIYDAQTNGYTDGEKSIDNQTFFMRLGQKIIHMLNTRTTTGALYDVDMRLRPSGNSGLLTTSITAFEKYQMQDAWTWEHQALVRARAICGSLRLKDMFNQVRTSVLSQHRDLNNLKQDIVNMREKMRLHLSSETKSKNTKSFHIKQDKGGIVDIEFMVQYAVLAWSHDDLALLTYTDNIRILECLANSSRLSAQEVDQLIAAYKAFRSVGHRLTLQQKSNIITADELLTERDNVQTLWNRWFINKNHHSNAI